MPEVRNKGYTKESVENVALTDCSVSKIAPCLTQ